MLAVGDAYAEVSFFDSLIPDLSGKFATLEDGGASCKGSASFFPHLVKLELLWRNWSPSQFGVKYIWSIDRRTLEYNRIGQINQDTPGFVTNKGWVSNSEENGLCAFIKDPYLNRKF